MFKVTYLRVTIVMLVVFFTLSFGLADYKYNVNIPYHNIQETERECGKTMEGGREGVRVWDKYTIQVLSED